MVSPDDLTGFFGDQWWTGFSSLGSIIGYSLLMIIVGVGLWFAFIYFQYKVKVTYFPIVGDTREERATIGRPKNDKGRQYKHKGIRKFKLFWARKSIKDIPYEHVYPDGVFLLRKSKDEFEPIPRPTLGNPSVQIKTLDTALEFWATLEQQELRRRFVDEDLQRKQMIMFVGVIIACLIFAGIVIWLSYATSNANLVKTDSLVNALNSLGDRIGVGGPG